MKNRLLIPNATDLVLSSTINFNPPDLSRNQHIIGSYLNRILTAGGGQWLSPVLGYYLSLADARGLGAAYDTLLPYTNEADTLATIQINRQYLRGFQDRLEWLRPSLWAPANTARSLSPANPVMLAFNGPDAQLGQFLASAEPASLPKRAGFWINGFSQFAHSSADGFMGFKYITAGTCAGFDYAFTDQLVAGVGGGYAGTNLDLNGDWGHSNFNSYFATVYGTYFTDRVYLEGVLSYGKHQYRDNRLIDLGTGRLSATSSHNGDSLSSVVEGGYTFRPQGFVIQPFASLAYIYLSEGSFQESGAGPLGLNLGSRQSNYLASEVGARLARPVKIPQGTIVPKVNAAWLHDFGVDKLTVPAAFQGAPTVGIAMNSRSLGENRAVLGAEVAFISKGGISASLRYDADLGNSFVSQAVTGQLKISF
jgi:outer membrane autotransporter protein